MIILGISGPFEHDPSAAILVDGKIVAACEEERFIRKKHAIWELPINSIHYCLEAAKAKPADINVIAYPWSPLAYKRGKWAYFWNVLGYRTSLAYKTIKKETQRCKSQKNRARVMLERSGIDPLKVKIEHVEHHLAHAASAYNLSGFKDAAVMTIDGAGEFVSTMFAEGVGGNIRKIKEIYYPDSLGLFYSIITEYLGFEMNDGEYKVMGMAPYGEAAKADFSKIIKFDEYGYKMNQRYVYIKNNEKYIPSKSFSRRMVKDWGPPREGDDLKAPYTHIAAGAQKILEDVTLKLLNTYLRDILERNDGRLCFAGGCALNVSLNRKILEQPYVKEFFVQPAAGDAGTALGAAVYVAHKSGDAIQKMDHVYLGPEYSAKEIEEALKTNNLKYENSREIEKVAASLLTRGEAVGWFQDRMEFGPRALGNRSILGNPSIQGVSDRINAIIKYREKWRPFCPSVLEGFENEIFENYHESEFMTMSFLVKNPWKKRIQEVVHVDGTARPQIVKKEKNAKFHNLISSFYENTGIPLLLNTSMNRRGEPMVCSPQDAINMFVDSGLKYLVMGDFLASKQ
ncbi:MAG: carbamoyltransferase [Candidatus Omnitrophica bacterium CG07_land_8_20_14_0_80_42_15]|uniref:Carbamoyltransferase n=1 Tax=Candidatus Aquitaenariimonas noxiae TaxID=1974741 RepID=A0A2J0KR63_9BACT|nr:MAG: carbamoyltransferase [Candidatus Omnitrophica bacterium CG07_land_8_20_14_0_80_42_15]